MHRQRCARGLTGAGTWHRQGYVEEELAHLLQMLRTAGSEGEGAETDESDETDEFGQETLQQVAPRFLSVFQVMLRALDADGADTDAREL